MQVLGGPTAILIWWFKRAKRPTRKIKGGAGALVLTGWGGGVGVNIYGVPMNPNDAKL